ncbi:prenyltransferase/squalene oxidase repeat-containing protein [Caulifigura coniformis]|nr:prenyltransferase/squalene oxidase repeat-containing protein [Caulifigura coniformis]
MSRSSIGSRFSAHELSRRDWLAITAGGLATFAIPVTTGAASLPADVRKSVATYLETLVRPDGGFAWDDQPTSHLSPTYAALGCYQILGVAPPEPKKHADFVRRNHPASWKKLEQEHREFDQMQIQSLLWLSEDVSEFRERVASWKKPVGYLKQYEKHGYPVFRHQLTAFTCRKLLGLPMDEIDPEFIEYLDSRRRPNGSFGNTPASDGSDGNILNTFWGLQALDILGRLGENRTAAVAWVLSCGFGLHQPDAKFAQQRDLAYTWAAIRCLELLKEDVSEIGTVARMIRLRQNDDGGFSDRPGWFSNAVATYYALDSLRAFQKFEPLPRSRPVPQTEALPADLKVFTIQIEAHGQGSPTEAVELARSLKIHLWGAKNAKAPWLKKAQETANREKVPVTFFVANEEYGTWVDFPGMGTYSHTSDIIAPAGADIGPSLANAGVVTWDEYREKRLKPLEEAGGRVLWQFGENEELVRLLLDDSIERGGFAAISTFHFGNPDFTNSEPFLKRYRGQLPFVGLQDAHGTEPWWFSDMTTGFRTLFLAREPTWEGWLESMKNQWVVAVRKDAVTNGALRMHGGSDAAVEFVKAREADWRWWENPEISRPLISLVAIRPEDVDEVGRPEHGIALRIRCAWVNTTQGQPKTPLVDFEALTVDGQPVMPEKIELRKGRGPGLSDVYYRWVDEAMPSGVRTAQVVGRVRETGDKVTRSLRF